MASPDRKPSYQATDLWVAVVSAYGITAKGVAALQEAHSKKSRGSIRQKPK